MGILLDTFYLFGFMALPGQFSETVQRVFEERRLLTADRQLIGHPLALTA